MQRILFLQSMWAMLSRHRDGFEPTLETNVQRIIDARYDGVSLPFLGRHEVGQVAGLLEPRGMVMEAVCFPTVVDDLKPVLELAAEFRPHHINLQPNVRPRRIQDCVSILEGWQRLAEQCDIPVYVETHRDRMTTDLLFTLDLLDQLPNLRLVADLSHYLVAREFAYPVSAENHAYIRRILDRAWALHGRVASREQVQVEISLPQHRIWLDLFLEWWRYGMQSWRTRAADNDSLVFVCELGPPPYAITDTQGEELTDRWNEALLLRETVAQLWKNLDC
ncbi:MAG TPA: hypothetical protein VGN30_05805 [Steroidobacteraceae bacterium]